MVQYQGQPSTRFRIPVTRTQPGLFSSNATGQGQGAILNADANGLSVNSSTNPAVKGSTIVLYGTGAGQTSPPSADGEVTGKTLNVFPPYSVTIGGLPAQISFFGAAPSLVAGVFQANVVIPANAPSGNVPVVVKIGDGTSQTNLTVAVK